MSYKDYLKDELKDAHKEIHNLKGYIELLETRFSEAKGEIIEVVLKMIKNKDKHITNDMLKDIYTKLDIILDKYIFDLRQSK
jgi:ribosome recycling factor